MLEEGRLLLGGVDVSEIGVGLLRRLITIVPQDPILFSGDLRRNLDPLGACFCYSKVRRVVLTPPSPPLS